MWTFSEVFFKVSSRIIFYLLTYHCTENHVFFFQTSWKDGLFKKSGLEYDLSYIIRKDDIPFSQKYDLSP